MTRRYSHCNGNGQTSRSGGGGGSGGGGLRLFGVRLTDGSFIKKSASMGSLSHQHSPTDNSPDGYHSDDIDDGFTARRRPLRKKGVPWTKPEHRQFLLGLEQLGRGNWRAISRNYVPTRTPTQVASHAQKYFLRLSNTNESGRRKRPSLFDLPTDMETDSSQQEQFSIPSAGVGGSNGDVMLSSFQEADTTNPPPSLDLSLKPAFTPFPFQLWPPNACSADDNEGEKSQHQILQPVQEEPIKELVCMSQLKLG